MAEKQHPLTDSPFYRGDCFGCGGDRTPGQGLRQTFSLLPEQSLVAATWTPDPELGPGGDELPAEHVWGALDCPGGWACRLFSAAPHETVTAHLATTVTKPVVLGEEHITFGWVISKAGRKHMVGSAIATRDGELCARSTALWLTLPPQAAW
ncbi:PaaI family thioesterase [Streptomyces sp. NPDC048650]|uniref:PaaI family thioesterase n=1 Tax=unclassified Streptomyces TaxID=2593676 RepID=UPI003714444C